MGFIHFGFHNNLLEGVLHLTHLPAMISALPHVYSSQLSLCIKVILENGFTPHFLVT